MNLDNFTNKAEAYAKGRPGYPREAFEKIIELASSESVFADIGAGTGKFTKELAEYGYTVYAVEPNADMRTQLAITLEPYKNVKIIEGTAEVTTLSDHSVDILSVSQDDSPLPSDPGYDAHIAALNAMFDCDSVDGLLRCDRATKIYSEIEAHY